MQTGYRTHTCGELRAEHENQSATLCGWVHRVRDMGGLTFFDIRDRFGLTQVMIDPESDSQLASLSGELKPEYVVRVTGEVRLREGGANEQLATGEVEIAAKEIEILSKAETPPLYINKAGDEDENLRFKYRYLDLRRDWNREKIIARSKATQAARDFLNKEGYIELETPLLIKSTPEGARDFLVPSRKFPGNFFALPQSPQLFKQLYMIAGFDRYFQFPHCFRDEDQRGNRQAEFTQIDIEASFVEQEDILVMAEGLFRAMWKETIGVELKTPWPRLSYAEAMERYGSDKPEIRFGTELNDCREIFKGSGFKVFGENIAQGGRVTGVFLEERPLGRGAVDKLEKWIKEIGARGLAWFKLENGEAAGGITKFLSAEEIAALKKLAGGDGTWFFISDTDRRSLELAGFLRLKLAEEFELIPADRKDEFAFLWVLDFPMFEQDDEGGLHAQHHPFTMPHRDDWDLLETHPEKVRSVAYDIVCNGEELGGGSIRIHDSELQQRVFKALKLSDEDIHRKFGFFVDALKYGTPPHGGIAPGFDRLVACMLRQESIKEVIAFPKTLKASDLMMDAPSGVDQVQLDELGLSINASDDEAGTQSIH